MNKSRWLLGPVIAAVLVIATACGGDDGDSSSADTAPAGGGHPTANQQLPAGRGSTTSQSLDLAQAADQLQDVESFRFDMKMNFDIDTPETGTPEEDAFAQGFLALLSNIAAEGAYVAPDRYQFAIDFLGMEIQVIQVGDEAWVNDGTGWVAASPDEAGLGMFDGSGSPADLAFEFLPQEILQGADVSSERVNGLDTTRYSFDKQSLAELAESLGEDVGELSEVDQMDLDVWLTDEGVPVKMSMQISGESEGSKIAVEVDFNITDLNDPTVTIERPI